MSALDQPSPFEDGHRYQVLTEAEFDTLVDAYDEEQEADE